MNSTNKIFIILYLYICCLILSSCEKENIFDIAKEPELTDSIESVIIGDFSVEVESITDHDLYLKWYPVGNANKYEIIINDTLVISNNINKENYLDYYYYKLTNLEANTDYEIAVRAINKDLNVRIASGITKTMKSFIDNVISISLDKYIYHYIDLYKHIETQDKGYLLIGRASIYGKYRGIIVKLNSDYSISFIKERDDEIIVDIKEFPDGGFLLIQNGSISKLNKQGNTLWQKKIDYDKIKEAIDLKSGLTFDDGTSIILGSFYTMTGSSYYIIKLSPNGEFLWQKIGKEITKDKEEDQYVLEKAIFSKKDNNVYITGSTKGGVLIMMAFDPKGNIITDNVYTTNEIPFAIFNINNIFLSFDQSFYVLGSASDWRSGRWNTITLTIKIDKEKKISWYKDNYFSAGGFFPSFYYSYKKEDNTFFCMIQDDRGIGFAQIDNTGDVLSYLGCYNYPTGIFAKLNDKEQIIYFTKNGQIITLNPDGYQPK